jgi:hypothetical protein
MLETQLTAEAAAAALAKLTNDRDVPGRAPAPFTDQLAPARHQCVIEWRDRIRNSLDRRRFPSRESN